MAFADGRVKDHRRATLMCIGFPARQIGCTRRAVAGKVDPGIAHAVGQGPGIPSITDAGFHFIDIMEDKGDFRRVVRHVDAVHDRRIPGEKIGIDWGTALSHFVFHDFQDRQANQRIDVERVGFVLVGIGIEEGTASVLSP